MNAKVIGKVSVPLRIPQDKEWEKKGGSIWWRVLHADHFESPQHVSDSKFAQFWGSHPEPVVQAHIPRRPR